MRKPEKQFVVCNGPKAYYTLREISQIFMFGHQFFWIFLFFSTKVSNKKMMRKYENLKTHSKKCVVCNRP